MLFNFPHFTVNGMTINLYINYIYALSWHIKHAGNKEWNGANGRHFERLVRNSFKRMYMVYEALNSMVCFLFRHVCIYSTI